MVAFNYYDSCVPTVENALKTMRMLLNKAQAHPEAEALLKTRIYEDMFDLSWQVFAVTSFAFRLADALGGPKLESRDSNIPTYEAALARIEDGLDVLSKLDRDAVNSLAEEVVAINVRENVLKLRAKDMTTKWTLPNVVFHVTVAYCILRMKGVVVGKLDYAHEFMLPYSLTNPTAHVDLD